MNDPDRSPLFSTFLTLAVNVALADLERRGGPTMDDVEEARAWGARLPEVADVMLFGEVRRSKTTSKTSGSSPGASLSLTARSLAVALWVLPEGHEVDLPGSVWKGLGRPISPRVS